MRIKTQPKSGREVVIDSLEHDNLKGKFVDINRRVASTFSSRRRFTEKIGKPNNR